MVSTPADLTAAGTSDAGSAAAADVGPVDALVAAVDALVAADVAADDALVDAELALLELLVAAFLLEQAVNARTAATVSTPAARVG
jgi:hypothetical protein